MKRWYTEPSTPWDSAMTTATSPASLPDVGEKQHVTRTPGVCGGKPCIAGTRIRVQDVYVLHEEQGLSAPEIVEYYPHLTIAGIYAALAYFWDHESVIREEMRQAAEFVAAMRAQAGPSKLDAYRQANSDDPLSL